MNAYIFEFEGLKIHKMQRCEVFMVKIIIIYREKHEQVNIELQR